MKVDFINDAPFHFGDFTQFEKFNRVDNWRNILSNKLCALSRHEPKDVVDILFIAKKYHFEWEEIFQEAIEKDLWVEPIEISKIIKGFKPELFRSINWVNPINFSELADSLDKLYKNVFYGNTNSLNSELRS